MKVSQLVFKAMMHLIFPCSIVGLKYSTVHTFICV
uniref:Uncharacterized protein n=1 Tax=Setaria italica TaxID=4555 RepID=K4A3T8_SETIT